MSTATTPASGETERCGTCQAPLAGDQRYCLHCGEVRRGARRPMPAALRPAAAPPSPPPASAAREPRELLIALAALACLLLAMVIGVLIGRSGNDDTSTRAVAAAPAAATPPAATPAAFTSDWPDGEAGWTIALRVLPKASTTPAAVAAARAQARGAGAPEAAALDSDDYPSLAAASYVVYSGRYPDQKAAKAALAGLTSSFPAARVVRVGPKEDPDAEGSKGAGSAKPKSSSGKPDTGTPAPVTPDTKRNDTEGEFEKSKKAPKTVGTQGKPPPKDDKPAGGGGGFDTIG